MKAEYDFSQGERGKFYHPDAVFNFPVYLEPDVNSFMSDLAEEKGIEVQKLVNSWLRNSMRLIQSVQTGNLQASSGSLAGNPNSQRRGAIAQKPHLQAVAGVAKEQRLNKIPIWPHGAKALG